MSRIVMPRICKKKIREEFDICLFSVKCFINNPLISDVNNKLNLTIHEIVENYFNTTDTK